MQQKNHPKQHQPNHYFQTTTCQ